MDEDGAVLVLGGHQDPVGRVGERPGPDLGQDVGAGVQDVEERLAAGGVALGDKPQAVRDLLDGVGGHGGVSRGQVVCGHQGRHVCGGLVVASGEAHVGHGDADGARPGEGQGVPGVVDGAPAGVPVVEGGSGALVGRVGVGLRALVGVRVGGHEVDGLGLGKGELKELLVRVLVCVGGNLRELVVAVKCGLELLAEVVGDACGHAGVNLVLGLCLLLAPVRGAAAHAAGENQDEDDHQDERRCAHQEDPAVDAAAAQAAPSGEVDVPGPERIAAVALATPQPAGVVAARDAGGAVVGAAGEVDTLAGAAGAGEPVSVEGGARPASAPASLGGAGT